ncbi:hypothetical protein BJ878DRAFT_569328 [Calycina marina]|uniref:Uncharacterized protein n=1 Tax=Calycina marina TaxID=1763456 RepID=A0A9P7YYR6_9HELO|nr:hypothetical protein BJ878DRAFT_569328 [Calycina marina]
MLDLELNKKHVSRAIKTFIDFRVPQLPFLEGDGTLQATLREQIYVKSTSTFLWVAFVLAELELIESYYVLDVLRETPSELVPFYHRMVEQIDMLQRKDPEFCRDVLATMMLAYRPLHLLELGALSNLPEQISKSRDHMTRLVHRCGSFLTIRDSTVYFVHQSAKDFLLEENTSQGIFRSGIGEVHHSIFSRSLRLMRSALRHDVHCLKAPGITIDQAKQPDLDPLGAVRYLCLYWVDHLRECQTREDLIKDLKDSELVYKFLKGVVIIRKLENLQLDERPELSAFIHDAGRFAVSNRSMIEQMPLQAYCSALVFAPEKSIVREAFKNCIPLWIQTKPRVETYWNAMLQTLEGHISVVTSVAFSPDGKQIVSGSWDKTRPALGRRHRRAAFAGSGGPYL